jgi:MSHA biogenesis protein MshK
MIMVMTVSVFMLGNAFAVAELPDPTRPVNYSEALPQVIEVHELPKELIDWRVTAIRIKDRDRSAIVNGQLVRVGDQIGTAKILEINPAAVVLDYEKKQVYVRLFSDVVDKKLSKNRTP